MDQLDLSYFFTTKAQAYDFSARLSTISDKIYQTSFNLEKNLIDEFGIQKKEKFMTLLRDNKIPVESNSQMKAFLDTLLEKISKLPVLILTISVEPDTKTLASLSEWFVLNLNKQILLDINIDNRLIAGASIKFQGKAMDFSIRPQFEKILENCLTNTIP